MEELKLDPVDLKTCQVPDGFQHILTGLTRKPQDHMDDDRQACGPQTAEGILKNGKPIAAADEPGW